MIPNLDDARADHGEGGAVICGAADRGSCAQRRRDSGSINAFGKTNPGLIVAASVNSDQRELITTLAVKHRMPAIYALRAFVASGGLAYTVRLGRPVPAERRHTSILSSGAPSPRTYRYSR